MFSAYKNWVRNNASAISYAEHGLSSLTFLLPDRFASSELLYEGINALVGLLGVWHDSILYEPVLSSPKTRQYQLCLAALQQIETLIELRALHLERLGKLNRYGPLTLLEFCKATLRLLLLLPHDAGQLLVSESVALTPSGTHEAQQSVVQQRFKHMQEALEWFKRRHATAAAGQLPSAMPPAPSSPAAPATRGKKPAQSAESGEPGRTEEAEARRDRHASSTAQHSIPPAPRAGGQATQRYPQQQGSFPAPCTTSQQDSCSAQHSRAQRRAHAAPASSDQPPRSGHKFWWDEANQGSEVGASGCSACGEQESQAVDWEVQLGQQMLLLGEVLYLYRPVLYVLLLKRHERRSWYPWVASLCVDLLSRALLNKAAAILTRATGRRFPEETSLCSMALLRRFSTFHWSAGEEREMLRRRVLLLHYLLRSPFFDSVTMPFIRRAQRPLRLVPLLGSISDKMVEILEGVQQYYTYTAAS